MKKIILIASAALFIVFLSSTVRTYAEDAPNPNPVIQSDKAAIASERQDMKQNATNAKSEETQLRQQIKDAKTAGNVEEVKKLRAQLKDLHKKNIAQRRDDKKELHKAKKEMRHDVRKAKEHQPQA